MKRISLAVVLFGLLVSQTFAQLGPQAAEIDRSIAELQTKVTALESDSHSHDSGIVRLPAGEYTGEMPITTPYTSAGGLQGVGSGVQAPAGHRLSDIISKIYVPADGVGILLHGSRKQVGQFSIESVGNGYRGEPTGTAILMRQDNWRVDEDDPHTNTQDGLGCGRHVVRDVYFHGFKMPSLPAKIGDRTTPTPPSMITYRLSGARQRCCCAPTWQWAMRSAILATRI